MRKITATILSLFGIALLGAPTLQRVSTQAQTTTSSLSTGLSFATLTDVATTKGYTAATSGNTLYLFNHEKGGFWQEYTHTQALSQISFDGQGNLYFRDAYRNLYTLHAAEWTETVAAQDTGIDCGSFFLNGNDLYYANAADSNTLVYEYSMDSSAPLLFNGSYKAFSFYDDVLYALDGENGLFTLSLSSQQATLLTRFSTSRTHLAVSGNQIFTSNADGLYCYDKSSGTENTLAQGEYAALCVQEDTLYALQEGQAYTYSIGSGGAPAKEAGEFGKPHIAHIPTGNLQENIEGTGTFTLVKTHPQALLIEVDFTAATELLPLIQTSRGEEMTALQIGETEDYALLAYRKAPSEPYQSFIVAKGSYDSLPQAHLTYEKAKIGYTSNEISLYKFPHLELPTLTEIPRGEEVTLLGEVNGLDCDYYEVRYGEQVGYLPKGYILDFANNAESPTQTVVGLEKENKDGVWRMVYILLGAAAIGILVDFLILRKKNND